MLIDNSEAEKRLNNPLNLMNRLRVGISPPKRQALALFTGGADRQETKVEVVIPESKVTTPLPSVEFDSGSVNDSDAKIKLAVAHDSALDLLTSSIGVLRKKLGNDEIRVSAIPGIITSASKVISDIRKERLERDKVKGDQNVHYHFYCPNQRKIDEYEVIEVEQQVG